MLKKYKSKIIIFTILLLLLPLLHTPAGAEAVNNTYYKVTYRALLSAPYQQGFALCGIVNAYYVRSNEGLNLSSIEISGWSCPSRDLEKIVKAVLQPENIGAKRLAEVSAGDPVIVFLPEGTESYACSHGMILYYKLQLLGNDKEVYVSMHRTEDGIVTWTSAYFYRDTLKPYSLILQPISVEPIPPDTCLHKFPSPAVKAGLAVASILITVLAAINASKFSREAQY